MMVFDNLNPLGNDATSETWNGQIGFRLHYR